jgi:hypothetical protein
VRSAGQSNSSVVEKVREEVEALHLFFVGWFTGELSQSEFEGGFLRRFDRDFLLVPPAGNLLTLAELGAGVKQAHATNPHFRIAIREVKVQRVLGDHILATYEEWQRNALASTPPDNARIATVLFENSEPLRWLHLHETWLPASLAAAGPYDF